MRNLITRSLRPVEDVQEWHKGPVSDYDLNSRPPAARPLTAAAVLVPLVERPDGHTVLLTQRTDHLHDHAGQISFPGGRMEAHDKSPVATALRETEEEVGLDAAFIEVVGCLDLYETGTGFLVTPVVAFVRPGFTLEPDSFEVAEVFEVPLAFLIDPGNRKKKSMHWKGAERQYYVIEYAQRYIWGATAGMIINFARRLER